MSKLEKFWIPNNLIDEGWLSKMSGNDLKAWIIIARHYNKNGTCFPSINRISKISGINPGTTSKSIHHLVELGLFTITERVRGSKVHYFYTESARKLIVDYQKPPEKTMPKEINKEYKESEYLKNNSTKPVSLWEAIEKDTKLSEDLKKKGIMKERNN